jgi:hypothetical protein
MLAATLWLTSSMAFAQTPGTVTKSDMVSASATIQAIDSTTRSVTLRTEKGEEDTFKVGPDMKRFDELKVGDKVKVTYYESIVFQLRKPGEKPTAPADDVAISAAKGKLPGGTVSAQQKTTVTVKAIDPKVPSITVVTEDGRTVTRKVDNPKNLEGVKVGDRIDITYTQALLVGIDRAAAK